MKKAISIFFFLLMIAVFAWEVYGGITGVIDVKRAYAELAARGASGHEYLGVGDDILAMGMILFSVVEFVLALVSWKIAQYRVIKIVSAVMCLLFWVPIVAVAVAMTS